MDGDLCTAALHDGGPPLRCRREAGHKGYHSVTDEIWWVSPDDPDYDKLMAAAYLLGMGQLVRIGGKP